MHFPKPPANWQVSISTLLISRMKGWNNLAQIGLARLITDEVTFDYIIDAHILLEYQRKGLGPGYWDASMRWWRAGLTWEEPCWWLATRKAKSCTRKLLGMDPFLHGRNGLDALSKLDGHDHGSPILLYSITSTALNQMNLVACKAQFYLLLSCCIL